MKNDTQLKVQAYLDNELSPGEARKVADLISADSGARELYGELKQTKNFLVPENEPLAAVRDTREFYWSRIQRGIEAQRLSAPERARSPWWFKLLLPVAGAVGLFAVLLSVSHPPAQTNTTSHSMAGISTAPMHEVEDLAPDISSITFRSEAEGVTVVWVTSQ